MTSTNQGRKTYICTTPQAADLDQTGFEALTFVMISNVGNIGETGTADNILNYDTMDTEVTQKQKGVANAGDPTIEVSRKPTDTGQIAMRDAAATKFEYAFKFEHADSPDGILTNTIIYSRGVVGGPTRPNGGVEDFDLEVYTVGLNQKEIVVDPA